MNHSFLKFSLNNNLLAKIQSLQLSTHRVYLYLVVYQDIVLVYLFDHIQNDFNQSGGDDHKMINFGLGLGSKPYPRIGRRSNPCKLAEVLDPSRKPFSYPTPFQYKRKVTTTLALQEALEVGEHQHRRIKTRALSLSLSVT